MASDSRLANEGAHLIAASWASFFDRFAIITRRARLRFLERDWRHMSDDHVERLELYTAFVDRTEADIRRLLGDRLESEVVWVGMKAVYSGLVSVRDDWELAETFFNSITRRIFATVGVDPKLEFVESDHDSRAPGPIAGIVEHHRGTDAAELVSEAMDAAGFAEHFADLDGDAEQASRLLLGRADQMGSTEVVGLELLRTVFYRGSAAYLVGRMWTPDDWSPVAFSLMNEPGGIRIDAVLTTENQLSILFSFTRSYFHAAAGRPRQIVDFLGELMPRKRRAELFISLGFNKHGKTELYRELMQHLSGSSDRFELAAGVPGLVMVVFTLPGFDVVFKVIRDKFGAPKQITRDRVMNRYRLVFRHDRAGRLVDAQEYEHLTFRADRFQPDLLEVLLEHCSRTVSRTGDMVHIAHAYVERRVTPLDVYIGRHGPAAGRAAIIDYGQAIKDLAAGGIFPGDMLLKNFGVTRHGRVVFYDYDELSTLDECTFRTMPVSDDPYDELSAEPWFSVGPDDVFPEEFRTFLGLSDELRAAFERHHGEIFEAEAWREWQRRVGRGERMEVFPYTDEQRIGGVPAS